MSCPSAASCVGVGSYVNSDNRQEILAEQWNGTSWAIPPTANPSAVVDSSLTGVSCASANACTAVGNGLTSSDTDVALAGQWNGSGWTFQTVPSPAYSSLSGVSCTAGNACTAVGSSNISSTSSQTLAQAWDGSSWTAQSTPNPSGATISALSGVSCTADGACTAVGYYINGSGADVTLSEQRTASTGWTIHLPANPGGASSSVLTGVSCTSGNACTAVGHSVSSSGVQQTLAEHWNGSSWTITLNTSGATNSSLSGVSCTADNACIAVGQTNGMTLAERWNPNSNSWTTLNTPALTNSALSGVSCTSGNACTTVGQASSGTLAERWDGTTFTIQTTTTPPLTGVLSSVSCATAAACSAVGHFNSENALAEQWDGTSWTIEPSPSWGASMYPVLSGDSCTAANACSAVGSMKHIYCPSSCNRGFKIVTGTMAMRFTGTGWSIVPTPNPSQGTPSSLSAVSCPSANACVAVGASGGGSLVEAWNGTSWTVQTPAQVGGLTSVSCPASNFCIAVGGALAERWNGTAWTSQTTPTPTGGDLVGVSCTATGCTAVGSSGGKTLAERWNGAAWSVQATPNPGDATSSSLSAISCPAANSCTAVGNYTNPSGTHLSLAEQWNGKTWTIQATPNPGGATYSALSGVACTTATACTAVGGSINASGTDVTLAETYT